MDRSTLTGIYITELVPQVKARVAEVVGLALGYDFEGAHAKEDQLYKDVLLKIYEGCSDPKSLAYEALETQWIQFGRHCV